MAMTELRAAASGKLRVAAGRMVGWSKLRLRGILQDPGPDVLQMARIRQQKVTTDDTDQ